MTPEDIAAAVAFLCSADAEMVRGQTLVVDGGFSLSQRLSSHRGETRRAVTWPAISGLGVLLQPPQRVLVPARAVRHVDAEWMPGATSSVAAARADAEQHLELVRIGSSAATRVRVSAISHSSCVAIAT